MSKLIHHIRSEVKFFATAREMDLSWFDGDIADILKTVDDS